MLGPDGPPTPTGVPNIVKDGTPAQRAVIGLPFASTVRHSRRPLPGGRGRDGPFGPPPAQIPACGTTAIKFKIRLLTYRFKDLPKVRITIIMLQNPPIEVYYLLTFERPKNLRLTL